MTNEMILKKAIKKAVKGGYTNLTYELYGEDWIEDTGYLSDGRLFGLIFDHSFAKAFWGIELSDIYVARVNDEIIIGLTWEHHLQQMALEPVPLRYLENYLDKEE